MDFIKDLPIKKVEKGELLLKQDEFCKFIYFVVSGCLKSYIIDKTGKEHILQFTPENWMVSDLDSFTNNVASSTFIEAIEPTEIKIIPKSFFENTSNLGKEELLTQNKKLIKNIIIANKRLALVLGSTAEDKYLDFCATYPTLVKRISLKLIASYIGITPEYLSELRRKLAGKS